MSFPRAEILAIHTTQLFAEAVRRAAALLRQGEVVALPTETVYGLAANALNPDAVEKIYAIKGRPAHNPIIVHIAGLEMARACVASWPLAAERLAAAFWPGPLSIVLPRANIIPAIVTAGGDAVALRWPSHPFMQAAINACAFPLAAPSANPSNQLSPTNAGHVARSLGNKIPLIIDGGQSQVGIESTVVDLSDGVPRLLRPGMISEAALAAVLGELRRNDSSRGEVLKSPGLLRKHYSPRAPLILLEWKDDNELLSLVGRQGAKNRVHIIAHSRVPSGEGFAGVSVIPHDAEAFARAIYSELHACDAVDADLIVVEALPDDPEWHAIRDRLQRASVR
jgi:L-threonylcarbamoyladenylate synthase